MMKRTAKVVLFVVIALMLTASLWAMSLQEQGKEQSKVVISEICFFPISGEPEWVELKSISNKPVSLAGWQITNGERIRIVLPEKMPEMPPQAHVLIMFDGKGDAKYVSEINDLSFAGDDLVVLHSPVQLKGNMFGDMTGQCALYAAGVRNATSIRSFVAWGSSTGKVLGVTKGLADAVNSGLWPSRDVLFTVARSSGGIKGPIAVIKPGGSIGFYGDCSGIQESNWLVFGPAETSPGKENPLPAPQLHLPGNGIRVDRSVGTFSWVKVSGAASYHFQICEDQECTHVVIDAQNCREPLYRPMEALPINAVYYWRVRAIDDSGYVSGWSTTYKLTVGYPKTNL